MSSKNLEPPFNQFASTTPMAANAIGSFVPALG
jgi:hypothetical protein